MRRLLWFTLQILNVCGSTGATTAANNIENEHNTATNPHFFLRRPQQQQQQQYESRRSLQESPRNDVLVAGNSGGREFADPDVFRGRTNPNANNNNPRQAAVVSARNRIPQNRGTTTTTTNSIATDTTDPFFSRPSSDGIAITRFPGDTTTNGIPHFAGRGSSLDQPKPESYFAGRTTGGGSNAIDRGGELDDDALELVNFLTAQFGDANLQASSLLLLETGTPQNRALEWLLGIDQIVTDLEVRGDDVWGSFTEGSIVQRTSDEQLVAERFALATIFFATGGEETWLERGDWLNPELSVCEWTNTAGSEVVARVTCDPTTQQVTRLELRNNQVTGELPAASLGWLTGLQELVIANDNDDEYSLEGTLPATLGDLPDLFLLDFAGNAALVGTFPDQICQNAAADAEFVVDCVQISCSCCICSEDDDNNDISLATSDAPSQAPTTQAFRFAQETRQNENLNVANQARSLRILNNFLSQLTVDGGAALNTPGTPQAQALEWLATTDQLFQQDFSFLASAAGSSSSATANGTLELADLTTDQRRLLERYAATVFHFSTGGSNLVDNNNNNNNNNNTDSSSSNANNNVIPWLDPNQEACLWGTTNTTTNSNTQTCGAQNEILELQVNRALVGELPPELGLLANLRSLDFLLNSALLSGTIPDPVCTTLVNNNAVLPQVDCTKVTCSCCPCRDSPSEMPSGFPSGMSSSGMPSERSSGMPSGMPSSGMPSQIPSSGTLSAMPSDELSTLAPSATPSQFPSRMHSNDPSAFPSNNQETTETGNNNQSTGSELLRQFLSALSVDNGAALSTPGTPQAQAFEWLTTTDQLFQQQFSFLNGAINNGSSNSNNNVDLASLSPREKRLVERYALTVLHFGTGGTNIVDNGNTDSNGNPISWLDPDAEACTWGSDIGNTDACGAADEVLLVQVDRPLVGELPPELGLLSNLQSFDFLNSALLSGTVPDQVCTNLVSNNAPTPHVDCTQVACSCCECIIGASEHPSATPSMLATNAPSEAPSQFPTPVASLQPSEFPSTRESEMPSIRSVIPSAFPSTKESGQPSDMPTSRSLVSPSAAPSPVPSLLQSVFPSTAPSIRDTQDASLQILQQFLSALSVDNGLALSSPGTPQAQAFEWLTTTDQLFGQDFNFLNGTLNSGISNSSNVNVENLTSQQQRLVERYAMAVFHFSTGGVDNGSTDFNGDVISWLDPNVESCAWGSGSVDSDACGAANEVLLIQVDRPLAGELPAELGLLTNLQSLDFLNSSLLSGSVPDQVCTNLLNNNAASLLPQVDCAQIICACCQCLDASSQPSGIPSVFSIHEPTNQPSYFPSQLPSSYSSNDPSLRPTESSTELPSHLPSAFPTTETTYTVTAYPSGLPSSHPSEDASSLLSTSPSTRPSSSASLSTSVARGMLSTQPSLGPSNHESKATTQFPSMRPSEFPSGQPVNQSSHLPSTNGSVMPSNTLSSTFPTSRPSALLTSSQPSMKSRSSPPTSSSSDLPSVSVLASSYFPTDIPSTSASFEPSVLPTTEASASPTDTNADRSFAPSIPPTIFSTEIHSVIPSNLPSLGTSTTAPSMLPTGESSRVPSSGPSVSPSHEASVAPSLIPTSFPTSQIPSSIPSEHSSSSPSYQPTKEPSQNPSKSPSNEPSTAPSNTPSVGSTTAPSDLPSFPPSHSGRPSQSPSTVPTTQPSSPPTKLPSGTPTKLPSGLPTISPSDTPSVAPTVSLSGRPSSAPSEGPSLLPSVSPSYIPSGNPSESPSSIPTTLPTDSPSSAPTIAPSDKPSSAPTLTPTGLPSIRPTLEPSPKPSASPSLLPSSSPSYRPSSMPTISPSDVPSVAPTLSPSGTPTSAPSEGPSRLPSVSPTDIPSGSPSESPSGIPTTLPTDSPSTAPTIAPSDKPSSAPTETPTWLPSIGPSLEPSLNPSASPSLLPSHSPSHIPTRTPTSSPSMNPSSIPSVVPSHQPSLTPSIVPTLLPSSSPSYEPSSIPSVGPTGEPSASPSIRPSYVPSDSPTSLPSATPSRMPSHDPSHSPSLVPSIIPSSMPSIAPTAFPTSNPSVMPSTMPSLLPSIVPSATPTAVPTSLPTVSPSVMPSLSPSGSPSLEPSDEPTIAPSSTPSLAPTGHPSFNPSNFPTQKPSYAPTVQPSLQPSESPSTKPSVMPSLSPSDQPSWMPTGVPTKNPTFIPTTEPSESPSEYPSPSPSALPSSIPSTTPTSSPSNVPSSFPTHNPSGIPSGAPTLLPSLSPSASPSVVPSSAHPSMLPSAKPSHIPSQIPTTIPSLNPTLAPSMVPSQFPSVNPSLWPTWEPSVAPSSVPSFAPSDGPTSLPSALPSQMPSHDPSHGPSLVPSIIPSLRPSSAPTVLPSSTPSEPPSGMPSSLPSSVPSAIPSIAPTAGPTVSPSEIPSLSPSGSPSLEPSGEPTIAPSSTPSIAPSGLPTFGPSLAPTGTPSSSPSVFPTLKPSVSPSMQPTGTPSLSPSGQPSSMPSESPSSYPSILPTQQPTGRPSISPSKSPSVNPSMQPSAFPSISPTMEPSSIPTGTPSTSPSARPSAIPSTSPSIAPSTSPSSLPSYEPSGSPSQHPSGLPSVHPSQIPTFFPSSAPSLLPSSAPSSIPSLFPSSAPSLLPSGLPSVHPSHLPSVLPSAVPTHLPSESPSDFPSVSPTLMPTMLPSVHPSLMPSSAPSATWQQLGATIDGIDSGDQFGWAVALSADGLTLAVGADESEGSGTGNGYVQVYQYDTDAMQWNQLGLDISGEASADDFGQSISLSADGTILAVGADQNTNANGRSGHVRVFAWDGTSWNQRGTDIDGGADDDRFGYAVVLSSADGSVLAVGAPDNDHDGLADAGHVRVFSWDGLAWNQLGDTIGGVASGDEFGSSVALSSDGSILAVSATRNDDNGFDSGVVKIYRYNSGWVQLGQDINGDASNNLAGYIVALSSNGRTVAIGTPWNDSNGDLAGQVRVWVLSILNQWEQLGQDLVGEAAGDQFGRNLALSSDGRTVAVGALGNDETGADAGHVRVFDYYSRTSRWELVGSDVDGELEGDRFGGYFGKTGVALSANGCIFAAGAPRSDGGGNLSGNVRIFSRVCSDTPTVSPAPSITQIPSSEPSNIPSAAPTGLWRQQGLDIDGISSADQFGWSVALSSDGLILAISADESEGSGTGNGYVQVYQYDNGAMQWNQLGLTISGEASADDFGQSISLTADGTILAVGADQNSNANGRSGHVRVFAWDGTSWNQRGTDIDGEAADDRFGDAVALNAGTGEVLAVGATRNDHNGMTNAGNVRVFSWDGLAWNQKGNTIGGAASGDRMGSSVALSSDGSILAVSAIYANGNGSDSGVVQVYNFVVSTWVQLGQDISGESSFDLSGYVVSLSSSGHTLAIGSPWNDGNGNRAGQVRVWILNGSNQWEQLGGDINGEVAEDQFGRSVALSADGETVAAGAINNDGNGDDSGHVRVFDYNSGTSTWEQVGSDVDGENAGDRFGGLYGRTGVALSGDGCSFAAGAPHNDANGNLAGHTRVFMRQQCT